MRRTSLGNLAHENVGATLGFCRNFMANAPRPATLGKGFAPSNRFPNAVDSRSQMRSMKEPTDKPFDGRVIRIRGAREHNLKNIDLTLPRDKLVVFTGLSGSGKSSLAFDTIYAEGQRRYVESLSSYARQFLGQMRSEEHTSELQSRFDLVCRLLLEKKNI